MRSGPTRRSPWPARPTATPITLDETAFGLAGVVVGEAEGTVVGHLIVAMDRSPMAVLKSCRWPVLRLSPYRQILLRQAFLRSQ
ncbi:hypothetical protein MESS2_1030189 [Mesorhizobium metallidurans STM 2683]|uniref:Uncharacterized protein n=1 Tax=Mesorhizobium metallidurans STM 2683 TaxID=1297569 RepID=M5EG66_9HYPH|nr:hypothetical protein MESS2_1030189 [Mesorhizobium metallidurans STM 2683]